ncbi:MAG: ABC transporter ATP-binding protein [Candidatus Schekmanbacteria bacterium]|nr:ABC transporter ATP-binding protein [Candidatus Schekmanbacteria bacterium]
MDYRQSLRIILRIFRYGFRHKPMLAAMAASTVFGGALTGYLVIILDYVIRLLSTFQTGASSASPSVFGEQVLTFLSWTTVGDDPALRVRSLSYVLFLLTPIAGTMAFAAWYSGQWIANRAVLDLKDDFLAHLVDLDLRFHDEMAKGDLITRVTADMGAVQSLQQALFGKLLQRPIEVVATLVFLFVLNWQLAAAIFLILLPAFGVVSRLFKRTRRRSLKARASLAQTLVALEQIISGIRVIKALGSAEVERQRYGEANKRFFEDNMRVVKSRAHADAVSDGAGFLLLGVALFSGSFLFSSRVIEPSHLITFLAAIGRMVSLLRTTQRAWGEVEENLPAAYRVFAILERRSCIRDPDNPQPCAPPRQAIRFDSVSFRYADDAEPVLRDVDLDIPVGMTVALVGESGSGKSTILDLIPRFHDVTSGRITIDDIDIRCFSRQNLTALMAIVQQESFLFNDTIYSNILYGRPDASPEEVVEAARRAHVHDAIMSLEGGQGYDTVVGNRGERLSGGQRQRVAIARALLRNAPILLLDEPTSALDAESESHVQQALDALMQGRTTVVAAHRLATIQHADLIYVLDRRDRRVLEKGTHQSLMALRGEYSRLVSMQQLESEIARDLPLPSVPWGPDGTPAHTLHPPTSLTTA